VPVKVKTGRKKGIAVASDHSFRELLFNQRVSREFKEQLELSRMRAGSKETFVEQNRRKSSLKPEESERKQRRVKFNDSSSDNVSNSNQASFESKDPTVGNTSAKNTT